MMDVFDTNPSTYRFWDPFGEKVEMYFLTDLIYKKLLILLTNQGSQVKVKID